MDVVQLKEYIVENNYVENILDGLGCHHIKYHSSGYWTCANKDGDNKNAIVIKNNDFLGCTNYTRQMISGSRTTDLIDLVCFNENLSFPDGLKYVCNLLGMDYYHNFDDDVPESLLITKMIMDMSESIDTTYDMPLKPISKNILSYYKNRVNDLFAKDNIDYKTQQEFMIGYDEYTNRITIPIFSEINDLVGVKGRLFKENLEEDDLKYLYLEPCARARILYGLNKTMAFIKKTGKVYVTEAEKGTMQLWAYGYRNSVATGGKKLSNSQIEMLTRLGVDIVFAFDKDVTTKELEELSERFLDNVPIYYILDSDNILLEKESPTDSPEKWSILVKKFMYRLK